MQFLKDPKKPLEPFLNFLRRFYRKDEEGVLNINHEYYNLNHNDFRSWNEYYTRRQELEQELFYDYLGFKKGVWYEYGFFHYSYANCSLSSILHNGFNLINKDLCLPPLDCKGVELKKDQNVIIGSSSGVVLEVKYNKVKIKRLRIRGSGYYNCWVYPWNLTVVKLPKPDFNYDSF